MIDPRYSDLLDRSAIPLDFAEKLGVRSIETDAELPPEFADWEGEGATPALLFPHPSAVDGAITWQLRPDVPVVDRAGARRKYLWPKGSPLVFTTHEQARKRLASPSSTVLLVEGTKQTIAALRWAPSEIAVVGIGGIWGHRQREVGLLADIAGLKLGKRRVVVAPDADFATNRQVFEGLQDILKAFEPLTAGKVTVAQLGGSGSAGLDDHLGMLSPDQRSDVIGNLVEKSSRRLPAKPPARDVFGDPKRATVQLSSFAGALVDRFDEELIVDEATGRLLIDYAGVWTPVLEAPAPLAYLLDGLGEHYARAKLEAVVELAATRLRLAGRILPELDAPPVVAFRNGIVRLDDPAPMLRPFDGQPPARVRFPFDWDDEAEAPLYEQWIAEKTAGDEDPVLLAEILGQLFDTTRSPERHLLLYGPSRSGKSTLQRIAQAMVDPRNRSHVSVHEMATDRFATSDLEGSRLNSVADLSSTSVRDLAQFKAATGDDLMRVQGKFERARRVRPTAVHVFSANAIPAIGEESRAYLARVVPINFSTTFLGREDPAVEQALMAELPAIAGLWLEEHVARVRLGRWTATDPATAAEFELASDRVREFLEDETKPGIWTNRMAIYKAYREWSQGAGYSPKAADRFYRSCESAGIATRKVRGDRQLEVGLRH